MQYKTIFTTERGERHQQSALRYAPDNLDITMLRNPTIDELKAHLHDAVYFISERRGIIGADLIANAPQLKLILRLGSLTYDIDLETAKSAGIIVSQIPDGGTIRVAEHVVMQILALLKKLRETQQIVLQASPHWGESKRTDENTFAYNWSGREGISGLRGKTIGILGFGEIGVELAKRLAGWGCQILYHKRQCFPEQVERQLNIDYVVAEGIYAQSDIVVNLLPYFAESDLSLNVRIFEQMKDGAFFVSVGSGSVIDEQALADAIESGKLAGTALDTYEYEPIKPDHPLIRLAQDGYNVLLTPHIAAGTGAQNMNERAEIYAPILDHIAGKSVHNRSV